jgi:hypothetical protein
VSAEHAGDAISGPSYGCGKLKPIGNVRARGCAAPPPHCTSTTNSARRRRSRSVVVVLIEPDNMIFWSTPAWLLPGVVHKNIGDCGIVLSKMAIRHLI